MVLKPQDNYLIKSETFIGFDFKLLINVSMTAPQILDLYILLLNNFYLILARSWYRYYIELKQDFLLSYLVLEIVFWFKQDSGLQNHFFNLVCNIH